MATPYEHVKTAWDSTDRQGNLNRVVEMMAGEGVSRDELDNALGKLLDEVRAEGVDEATEEIINSVGDRLHGWCHKSRHIQFEIPLPTKKDAEQLPRWACVAFAARCARRVLPVFAKKWTDAPIDLLKQLSWAVDIGERSAAHAGVGDDWAPPAGALTCAAYVCDAIINADRNRVRAVEVINEMRRAVAVFKDQAENVMDRFIGEYFEILTKNALLGIADGIATNEETHQAAKRFATGVIRRDFERLAHVAHEQKWTDDTPVPPTFFGPMWPEGPPLNWPQEATIAQLPHPEITVRLATELLVA